MMTSDDTSIGTEHANPLLCTWQYDVKLEYVTNDAYFITSLPRSGQLYGAPGLCQMEQHMLVNSFDEVVKYSYINISSIEFKGILFVSNTNRNFVLR